MNSKLFINYIFLAIGVASCLYIIFSIIVRIIKKELALIREDFFKQIKKGKMSASHR